MPSLCLVTALDSPTAVWDRMKVAWWRFKYAGPEEQVILLARKTYAVESGVLEGLDETLGCPVS